MKVVIKNGKVNGKPIIRAWESFSDWYWFGLEEVSPGYWFGFVVGICPEFGYFSERELNELKHQIWPVKQCDIPFIDKVVET